MMKKREQQEVVELYYDYRKAYDTVNHAFLEELLDVYGFPYGIQMLIVEMMARWKIHLSYRARKEVGEVRLANGIIQADAFSPLPFVLMKTSSSRHRREDLDAMPKSSTTWMT